MYTREECKEITELRELVSKEFFNTYVGPLEQRVRYTDDGGARSFLTCLLFLVKTKMYTEEELSLLTFESIFSFSKYYRNFKSINEFVKLWRAGGEKAVLEFLSPVLKEKEQRAFIDSFDKYGESAKILAQEMSRERAAALKQKVLSKDIAIANVSGLLVDSSILDSDVYWGKKIPAQMVESKLCELLNKTLVRSFKMYNELLNLKVDQIWWLLLIVNGNFCMVPMYEIFFSEDLQRFISETPRYGIKFLAYDNVFVLAFDSEYTDVRIPKIHEKYEYFYTHPDVLDKNDLFPMESFLVSCGMNRDEVLRVYPSEWALPFNYAGGY